MIIFRYLSKEIFASLLAVTMILLLIFMSNQFVRYLGSAATGKIALMAMLNLMVLEIPHLLGILLPVSLFIGLMLAYGRLYADNEMLVLATSGVSLSTVRAERPRFVCARCICDVAMIALDCSTEMVRCLVLRAAVATAS